MSRSVDLLPAKSLLSTSFFDSRPTVATPSFPDSSRPAARLLSEPSSRRRFRSSD